MSAPTLSESIDPREPSPMPPSTDDEPEIDRIRAVLEARLLGTSSTNAHIGRFTVLEKIGSGGMGVVYAAYDERLDRRVAIKLLHGATDESVSTERLVREARSMARLSHPHVATVHEIGEHRGRTFVAMEFIRGRTLRRWQAEARPTWSQVLAVYLQAAKGLAAAHAAGLVHRDFKPDNAMIDDEGTVKVLDFGLARASMHDVTDAPTLGSGSGTSGETPLTRSGVLAGTPVYMAPEQLDGKPAEPGSDQFAFCVALFEALYGQRPFAGATIGEHIVAVMAGRVTIPSGAGVPKWLRHVVRRGLAVDPADRHASMHALIDAVQRGQARARARPWLGLASLLAFGVLALMGWKQLDRRSRSAACAAAGDSIDDTWNDDARGSVRSALLASGASFAATTADKVVPWLDAQAEAWRRARSETCLDADVREIWDAATRDRSVWCLEDRRLELDALVTELTRADAKIVIKAIPAAAGLAPVAPCRDRDRLVRLPAPPTEQRSELGSIRAELARASALRRTGKLDDAIAIVQRVLPRAQALGFAPLLAEATTLHGTLLERIADYAQAERVLERAYFIAAHAGALDVATEAADMLVFVTGCQLARHEDALRWSEHADVMTESLPDVAGLRRAVHDGHLACVRAGMGSYKEARPFLEHALAIRLEALGPDHPTVADTLNNLAVLNEKSGAYAEAERLHQRALAILETAFGPDHPELAQTLDNLANAHWSAGELTKAKALQERALAIREAALHPEHSDIAGNLNNLAGVHWQMGEYAQAKPLLQRALRLREAALGPEHPEVASILNGLALLHESAGELDEAIAMHMRALAIAENVLGPQHPQVAATLNNLAGVHAKMGARGEAKRLLERALQIRQAALGPDAIDVATTLYGLGSIQRSEGEHAIARESLTRALEIWENAPGGEHPRVAHALRELAELAIAEGRTADAIAFAERALQTSERNDAPANELAKGRFVLARALRDRDAERAHDLAMAARDGFGQAASTSLERDEVEQWIATSLKR